MGKISTSDVALALRSQGVLITDKEIKKLIVKHDSGRTGYIDFDTFIKMMQESYNQRPDNEREV